MQGARVSGVEVIKLDRHTRVTELTIERAKRLVENGRDVVIVMDSSVLMIMSKTRGVARKVKCSRA